MFLLFVFVVGSGIRNGKKSGSGINIPDLQHRVPHLAVLRQSFGKKIMLTLKLDKIPFVKYGAQNRERDYAISIFFYGNHTECGSIYPDYWHICLRIFPHKFMCNFFTKSEDFSCYISLVVGTKCSKAIPASQCRQNEGKVDSKHAGKSSPDQQSNS